MQFRRKKCASERRIFNSSPIFDFFTCRPAKYTALPAQHIRTQKKRFPCLIFGARISNLPSKYGKASSIASEFGARVCAASEINNYNYCVLGQTSTIIVYANNWPLCKHGTMAKGSPEIPQIRKFTCKQFTCKQFTCKQFTVNWLIVALTC